MPIGTALALGLGSLAGGIGGAFGKSNSLTSTVNAGMPTSTEIMGQQMQNDNAGQLQQLVNAGPGKQSVTDSLSASNDLAAMLKQYSTPGGNLPTSQDLSTSQSLASSLFAPQQTALNQSFQDQQINANKQAVLSGRDINDPILRAKLAYDQTRQQAVLSGEQNAFASQYAMNQPMQRLQFAGQRADVLGGLASQALANRQALASMGSGIMNNERNFRLATAQRTSTEQQGGGPGGAISGAIGGLGSGMSMLGSLQNMNMNQSLFNNFMKNGGYGNSQTPPNWLPQAMGGQPFQQYSSPAGPMMPPAPIYSGSNTNWMNNPYGHNAGGMP